MARPKKKKAPTVSLSTTLDDDALLDAAIAEKDAAVRKMQAEAKEKDSSELALSAQLAAAKLGMQEQLHPRLSVKELVERMNVVPTFAIVNVTGGGKRHVPMRFADDEVTPQEVCAFFADPAEAKRALGQAQRTCPDMELVLGAVPLGNAFSLVVGWAEAKGSAPFTIRGSETLTKDMRPHLKKQLDKLGMPSYWQCPVILCDEVTSATVTPVFLDHAGLTLTWKAVGRSEPPPSSLKIIDLRILINTMLAPDSKGVNWTTARFLGVQSGHDMATAGLDQLEAAGGVGSGKGSGDGLKASVDTSLLRAPAEADDDPPALEPSCKAVEVQ